MDALGVNGDAGNTRATDAFHASPGYDWTRSQGIDAVNRSANARGMLGSGNTDADLLKYATGLANQEYGGWLDRLGGYVSPELSATSGAAGGRAAGYGALSGLSTDVAGKRLGLLNQRTDGQAGANNQIAQAGQQGSANLWGLGLNALTGLAGSNLFKQPNSSFW